MQEWVKRLDLKQAAQNFKIANQNVKDLWEVYRTDKSVKEDYLKAEEDFQDLDERIKELVLEDIANRQALAR